MPTNNDDTIYSTALNDHIQGLAGADTFYWTPSGQDTFTGGDQGERYDPNPYMERTGGDQLHIAGNVGANVRFASTEAGVVTVGSHSLKFEGVERFYGTSGNDTIRGDGARVEAAHFGTPVHGLTIYAGAGNDSIIGSSQDDVLDGGAGNDTIRGGDGHDFIQSSTGNDLIYGGSGADLINVWVTEGPLWAADSVVGGNVRITTTRADGAMSGVATVGTNDHGGKSTLRFQGFEQGWTHEGNDIVTGAAAKVSGNVGFHWNTRWGNDLITGTAGNDTLEGGEGSDTIEGGAGDDLISANGDFFDTDAPGDGDADTLIFRAGHGHDTVLAFDAGVDVLDLGGRDYIATDTAAGTMLTAGQDTILLAGVHDFEV